jgi:hypothetical protein
MARRPQRRLDRRQPPTGGRETLIEDRLTSEGILFLFEWVGIFIGTAFYKVGILALGPEVEKNDKTRVNRCMTKMRRK